MASPGTGLLELGAVGLLAVAGWLIVVANQPINLLALGVILVGAALFALSLRRPRQLVLLALAILAL
jgi:hypothetical protein